MRRRAVSADGPFLVTISEFMIITVSVMIIAVKGVVADTLQGP